MLPADGIHVEYRAPAGCPSEAAFTWQVRARVRQVSAPLRRYAVVITVDGPRARGTLRVEEETRTSVRELAGATCDEIAEGLALILALVVDPGARTEPARDLPLQPSPEKTPEPKPALPLAASVLNPGSDVSPQPRSAPLVWRPSLNAGADAVMRSALAPGTTTAGRGFLEMGLDRRAALSPHLRVGLEYAKSSPLVDSAGTAQFSWLIGVTEVCHAEQVLERLTVPICAGVAWGRLEATGSATTNAQTQTQTWLSLDADVGLRWSPWSVPIFVDVEGGIQVPLNRARFYFEPGTTVYTTPRVAPFVGLGAGVRIL